MTRSMNHSLVNNVYMNNENDNSKNLKHNLVLKRMITHLTRKTGRRKKRQQTTRVLFFNDWQFRHKPSCQQREVTQDPVCVRVTKELLNYCCVVTPKIHREGRSTIIYIYSFEKDCRKKCTRQSRTVLWVVLSSPFLKEIWENASRGHGYKLCLRMLKESNQLQCQEQWIDRIQYYRSGLSGAHFFRQPSLR